MQKNKTCVICFTVYSNIMFEDPGCLNKIFRRVKCPHQNWSNINKRSDTKERFLPEEIELGKNKEVTKGGNLKWQLSVCSFKNVRTMYRTGKHYFQTKYVILFFL